MATTIKTTYIGDEQVELTHGPTGDKIKTDLPPDNDGKGRTFSPTDLFTSALASCVITIMAKVAERDGLDIKGTTIDIEKHMQENPRRVSKFTGVINFSAGLEDKDKRKLLKCVEACPVHKSLHPDIEVDFTIA